MRKLVTLAGLGMVMALGACTQDRNEAGAETTGTAALGGGDACGAEAMQGLVGSSIGSLDASTLPEDRRVIFPGMAVTQDFRESRLNVEVSPDDTIARIYCG
ncbi:MAG TPA: I78 family peptidase inhibitor [Paracoccaceae bacterium]|nr:I78 family peptidase inhibitor [Paracoccaceae bacterium]